MNICDDYTISTIPMVYLFQFVRQQDYHLYPPNSAPGYGGGDDLFARRHMGNSNFLYIDGHVEKHNYEWMEAHPGQYTRAPND